MSDEAGKPLGGDRREERRSDRDRYRSVNNPLRDEVWTALVQLGINLNDQESVREFTETYEWAREARKREEHNRTLRRQILAGGTIGAIVAAIGWVVTWLTSHATAGGGQH